MRNTLLARIFQAGLVLLTAALLIVRTMIGLQDPDYWNPVTPLDYAAVWWGSAALLGAASVGWLLGWLARADRPSGVAAMVGGAGMALAAVVNVFEDGFGMHELGTFFVLGTITASLGLIALTVALAKAGARMLALLAAATLFGPFVVGGVVGFVVPVVYAWFAFVLIRQPASLAPRRQPGPLPAETG